MMDKVDLLIIFNTGKCNVIRDVTDYGVVDDTLFYFEVNNFRSFLPINNIRYFGNLDAWSNTYTDKYGNEIRL